MSHRFPIALLVVVLMQLPWATVRAAGEGSCAGDLGVQSTSVLTEVDLNTGTTRLLTSLTGEYLSIVAVAPGVICLHRAPVFEPGFRALDPRGYVQGVSLSDGKELWSMVSDRTTYLPSAPELPLNLPREWSSRASLVPHVQVTQRESILVFTSYQQGRDLSRSLTLVNARSGKMEWQRELGGPHVSDSTRFMLPLVVENRVLYGRRVALDLESGRDAWEAPGYLRVTMSENHLVGWTPGSAGSSNRADQPGELWSILRKGTDKVVKASIPFREELIGVSSTRITMLKVSDTGGVIQLISRDIDSPDRILGESESRDKIFLDRSLIVRGDRKVYFGANRTVGADLETGQFLFVEKWEDRESPAWVDGNVVYSISAKGIVARSATTGLDPKLIWTAKDIPEASVRSLRLVIPNHARTEIKRELWKYGCRISSLVIVDRKMYFIAYNWSPLSE